MFVVGREVFMVGGEGNVNAEEEEEEEVRSAIHLDSVIEPTVPPVM